MWTNILLFFIALVLTVILCVLFYLARSLQRIPDGKIEEAKAKLSGISKEPTKNAYAKNGISKALAKELKEKMLAKMQSEAYYLDPDFNIKDLARELSLSKHQTSLILNKELQMDFYAFINRFRVEKAKQLLLTDDAQIGEVLFEAGFNNSATFNRAFKKETGMTPRQFVQNNQLRVRTAQAI